MINGISIFVSLGTVFANPVTFVDNTVIKILLRFISPRAMYIAII